jgi:hypothetical protein
MFFPCVIAHVCYVSVGCEFNHVLSKHNGITGLEYILSVSAVDNGWGAAIVGIPVAPNLGCRLFGKCDVCLIPVLQITVPVVEMENEISEMTGPLALCVLTFVKIFVNKSSSGKGM